MIEQDALDRITDKVFDPDLKVIAGEPGTILEIGDFKIECYVLEDETRVLSQRGTFDALGVSRGGARGAGAQIPRFATSNALNPYISRDLMLALSSPIRFSNPRGGRSAHGYPAEILVDICEAILAARDAGALTSRQGPMARRADLIIRGLANVAIVSLVDEATGYQYIRARNALAEILNKFIAEEFRPWTKTFPYEFYKQIYRLREWGEPNSNHRPAVIGRYTNDLVYARIAPGVLDELRRVNPVRPGGRRRQMHHQWFTEDIGHPKLKDHLAGVIALMRASATWDQFQHLVNRAYPKINTNFEMRIEDH